MKEKVKRKVKDIERIRKEIKNHYILKFFNIFCAKYEFTNLTYREKRFLLKEFWNTGTIAAFKLKYFETEENPQGALGFAPYATTAFDMYLQPAAINLINLKGVNAIPNGVLPVDEKVVIGWIQPNRTSIMNMIENDLRMIVQIEMLINSNINASKVPFVVATTPEEEFKLKNLIERVFNDEEILFTGSDELEKIKVLLTGAPYLLDKLEQNLDYRENRIKTYLGINNVNIRKKERLITSEAESNNEEIKINSDVFMDELKDFFNRIYEVLNIRVDVKLKEKNEMEENDDEL